MCVCVCVCVCVWMDASCVLHIRFIKRLKNGKKCKRNSISLWRPNLYYKLFSMQLFS